LIADILNITTFQTGLILPICWRYHRFRARFHYPNIWYRLQIKKAWTFNVKTNDVANAIGPLAVIPINYGYGALATRIHHIPDPSPGKSFEDQVFLFFFVPFVLLNKKRFPAVIGFSRIVH